MSKDMASMSDRQACWSARDVYWKCLDEGKTDGECSKFRRAYESNCSSTWVKHFDRKHSLEKYKEEIRDANWQMKPGDYKPSGSGNK